MTEASASVPCPHPIEFRGGADCHLCGNSGFVLPGSPWVPPVERVAEEASQVRAIPEQNTSVGSE
jgi:hypothetical protein